MLDWIDLVKEGQKSAPLSLYSVATISRDLSGTPHPEIRTISLRTPLPPTSPNSPHLLMFSTDLRTAKCASLSLSPHISLCSYLPALSPPTQIRIEGRGYVFGPNGWAGLGEMPGERVWREHDWKRIRREMFDAPELPDKIRAWHARPTPGTPLDQAPPREEWVQQLPTDTPDTSLLETAFANFALIVILPTHIDVVQLNATGLDSRWVWDWVADEEGKGEAGGGRYVRVEVVP